MQKKVKTKVVKGFLTSTFKIKLIPTNNSFLCVHKVFATSKITVKWTETGLEKIELYCCISLTTYDI